jgi:hypothetical protein
MAGLGLLSLQLSLPRKRNRDPTSATIFLKELKKNFFSVHFSKGLPSYM